MLASADSRHREGVVHFVPETDEIVALSLEGEFDMGDARTVREEIDRTLEGGKDLIVDLSGATFVDSSLIDVLCRAAKAAREKERAIVLQVGTAATVRRVLELTRIEEVLPRAHDRREALELIQKQAGAGQAHREPSDPPARPDRLECRAGPAVTLALEVGAAALVCSLALLWALR